MKIIYNKIIPFPGFTAMAFFGYIFARKNPLPSYVIKHEEIHLEQAKRCGGWIKFYYKYLKEYIKNVFKYLDLGLAYRLISFELEAYSRLYEK